jgi:hypothetical protein
LRLVFSREWLESREVAHEEEVLEVETRGSPREFFDGATTAGESPSRTHVPTGIRW